MPDPCFIHRCPYTRDRCPINDRRFLDLLLSWMQQGRSPRSPALQAGSISGSEDAAQKLMVKVSTVTALLTDEMSIIRIIERMERGQQVIRCKTDCSNLVRSYNRVRTRLWGRRPLRMKGYGKQEGFGRAQKAGQDRGCNNRPDRPGRASSPCVSPE